MIERVTNLTIILMSFDLRHGSCEEYVLSDSATCRRAERGTSRAEGDSSGSI